jgi:asparagine synthase (glutamine-hydrolysing)
MCGISGIISLKSQKIEGLNKKLAVMNKLLAHRGPDGEGTWTNLSKTIGLAHRRLSIIDLNESADQPMQGVNGNTIVYNGEIYNYVELKDSLGTHWQFKTKSDT